ncbi:ATP-binding protein [Kamptonema sp. UHCC 0994]|uniref:sensor histidine kinase n=1 Tax=Kamptonema sp. UHCC 0994 TaxID=3031329 RepID=UPI0023B8DEFC|nr:ATP-binding protein [Kamptonema sp. UHCC 0994]MDF0554114.1 ATP-binding protein [Kamptonema sp. UHCC 0994]
MTNRVQKVQPPSNLIATLQSFSIKSGMAVALIGCIVILGWIFDIAILKSVLPGLVTMKANTAVSFILSGSSLWLLGRQRVGRKWNKLGFIQPEILAISVIAINLLTLIQYGFNLNFGIDQLLFKESATAVATAAPGRMAPNTALTFLLLGYSLLMLSISRSRYILTQGLSLAGFLIALLGFLGYIYGNSSLYRAGSYTAMAIHTASGFLLLSLGILLACPERGLMAIITSKNAGGIVARQLLPAVIILPPVIGKLILVIFSPRLYSAEWLICLFAVFNIVIFGGLLWWNARKIGIVDRQRYEAEIKLQEANEELENRVLERTANLQSANEMLHQQIITNQQTEEALKQSYNLLRTVIDSTPDAIFVKDIYGCYTILNSAAASMIGMLPEEILGRNDRDLFSSEIAEKIIENDREIIAIGEPKMLEEEVFTMGKRRTFLSTKNACRNAKGNVSGIVSIARDISDRVQVLEALKQSEEQYREQATLLEKSLRELQQTQAQLIQTEKISSLGLLVAGVAHEINNPINFIYGNITYATNYANDLLNFIQLYQQYYPNPTARIQEEAENIELDYLIEDFPKILDSMKLGADRIRDLVVSLRNFSRLDEAEMKSVNIHEGIESTLLMLKHRLKATPEMPAIKVIKEYGDLPLVECYPGQLNQVFMNLIANAIDAIEEHNSQRSFAEIKSNPNRIHIRTQVIDSDWVEIRIDDNGPGMNEAVWRKLFDPFFTTKAIGKGTGLGLSISYQIVVEKHRGKLQCSSTPGEGAEFVIQIPIQQ